jgi:hypothetical protein
MDKIIQVLVLLEKRTKTMETRLKRIEARVDETVNSKSGSTKITAGSTRTREGECAQMRHGMVPADAVHPWSAVAGSYPRGGAMGLPEKAELFVRMGLHGSGVTGRIHSSIMNSSYNAIQDIFELA